MLVFIDNNAGENGHTGAVFMNVPKSSGKIVYWRIREMRSPSSLRVPNPKHAWHISRPSLPLRGHLDPSR